MDQPLNPRILQFSIRHAAFPADRDIVARLFRDYQQNIQVDLCFQSFDHELATLPGRYVAVLLAEHDGDFLGCIALRPLGQTEPGVGEMKRLFVAPAARGLGVGKALLLAAIAEARSLAFHTLRLDTVEDKMSSAIRLYRQAGFQDIGRRQEGSLGLLDMELRLDRELPRR